MHKEVPSKKPTKVTILLAIEVRPQLNPCPSTTSYFVSESSIRSKEGMGHALSNEGMQGSLVTTQNVPQEQQPRSDGNVVIHSSPIPMAPINIETCNNFTSLVVDLSGIQEDDMEKSASPVKSLLSNKVKNIDGIPIGTTR
ncbi:unnamed protein product [Ilex paraguariensis]|uniref:Uncharacterized protein n=1 Tax=Ilex paraguariensis TaxID=185542 RepID=A0ABC8QPH0_9AQUA